MTDDFVNEISRLHQVIEGWTTGELPDTDAAFGGFAMSLESTFVIINPEGLAEPRDRVVDRFRHLHGARGGIGFGITIAEAIVRQTIGDHALVTYHEVWTKEASPAGTILASAWLRRNERTPGGIGWLHLHETWLTPPPPA